MNVAKCPMCGKNSAEEDMKYQFIDDDGTEYYVCAECDKAITSVSDNSEDSETSLKYVKECSSSCSDKKLASWLNEITDTYLSEKKEQEIIAKESDPNNTTVWISSLRQIFKIGFILIIIIGLILCLLLAETNVGLGLIILSVSILIAVMVVGFEIVFLDMARDLHQIKNILEEIKNKEEE